MSDTCISVSVVTGNQLAYRFIASILSGSFETSRYGGEDASVDSLPGSHVIVIDSAQIGIMVTELVRKLRARHPDSHFIVINHGSRDLSASHLLSSGMHALIPHDQVEEMLEQAIRCIVSGGIWFSSRYARSYQSVQTHAGNDEAGLTPREVQVLELVSRRLSNKEIADTLDIRESTVKYHIANLFGKLQVSSRMALATTGIATSLELLL